MLRIDADAHVVETPKTWSYMRETEQDFRPQIFVRNTGDGAPVRSNQRNEYWKIGDYWQTKTNVGYDVPDEARDMIDIERRLAHMEEIGIDMQVLFPTIFLQPCTKDHDAEFAIVRSYNRWLADIWKQSHGKLRWVAAPPLLTLVDPPRVREELEFCKANGACGIFMRGMECERMITHRFFHPLYAMAQDLDLAICFHAGNNSFANFTSYPREAAMMHFKFPILGAFCNLLTEKTPQKFPALRWAFIEVSAQWVPYLLNEARYRLATEMRRSFGDLLADNRFYITTQRSDDLAWLLSELGDDHLVIGTDYGHNDSASEVLALKRLANDGTIAKTAIEKILADNPSKLYGFS
jgi:predicted TIM-barrel fold metal-dependent hydrolase